MLLEKKEILNGITIELYDFSDLSSANKINYIVGKIASISYGNNEAKNPEKLIKRLLSLGHMKPFEFIRIYNPRYYMPLILKNKLIEKDISNPKYTLFINNYEMLGGQEKHRQYVATFKLKIPIFVARQLVRHCHLAYLEMSRRYVKDSKHKFEFYMVPGNMDEENEIIIKSTELYYKLLEKGFKPEIARIYLPLNLMTEVYINGDILSFAKFFALRYHDKAQYEIKEMAKAMLVMLKNKQPEFIKKLLFILAEIQEKYGAIWESEQTIWHPFERQYAKELLKNLEFIN